MNGTAADRQPSSAMRARRSLRTWAMTHRPTSTLLVARDDEVHGDHSLAVEAP